MKIPNILTISRFFFIPFILWLLYSNNASYILIGMILFVVAIITDGLDGYIARKFKNQKSVFGTFFDPLVDKVLILSLFFVFVDLDIIPLWLILLILFRELMVTGIRQVCSKPKRIVGANWMGKSKFHMQWINILYLHFVLYFSLRGIENVFFTKIVAFYFTLIVTVISLFYAINFLRWYKKELLSDI